MCLEYYYPLSMMLAHPCYLGAYAALIAQVSVCCITLPDVAVSLLTLRYFPYLPLRRASVGHDGLLSTMPGSVHPNVHMISM